ncbi:MAG: hypothetical protein A2W91_03960 [Bacteroidetes bacterium GWF2_38_335]|nr:MAG: hypothetical protein A2W91_03960 [Bacteroidetes bacterium GWF2_38_335]OFY79106.1 MAG: hypothetical protein A2281_03295 [Bacteroidetes bacterium RIFOXYA12_FULL_38_20]HBS88808.1 hypothetical protein [Bacteroidales bacterium]
MRIFNTILLILLICQTYAQVNDTTPVMIDEVVVTATRGERIVKNVPGKIDIISSEKIQASPVLNIDDILRTSANVYVNRSWGIFSKNSSVTMRGLESSDRTLILIDGVPKNKLSGGSVNWHNVNPDEVERIEVIKGPASALYGTNAMGGVINIITKKPQEKLSGNIKAFAGKYNTLGSSLNLSGSKIKENKGFYWGINGLYRQGDGYIFEPAEALDSTDTETFLTEYGGGIKTGYQISKNNSIEIAYDYYDELRGGGVQVHEEDGSYDKAKTHQGRINYSGKIGKTTLKVLASMLREDYYSQKESLNDFYEYKLSDASTVKNDKGVWMIAGNELFKNNYITGGIEIRTGDVNGNETYRTTPDLINYEGFLNVYALFLQDEINLVKEKLKVIAGLRNDIITFNNGWQTVDDPSKETGFTESFYEKFDNHQWSAFSPKLAVKYLFNSLSDVYVSFATGYKPPKIDDLCKSGKIRKGFRLANPELRPEKLFTYEVGYSRIFLKKIKVSTAVYYSKGIDFQYLIGTGDTLEVEGSDPKPILTRENIAEVEIYGGELSVNYQVVKSISFNLNYSYNHSIVLDYQMEEGNPSKDLSGLYLIEVSPHLFYAGATWKNKLLNCHLNCTYTGSQWVDDENTQLLEDYFLLNMRLSKELKSGLGCWIDIQNILDNQFIDRKSQLSPGRFVLGGVGFRF